MNRIVTASAAKMQADFRLFVWYLWTLHLGLPNPTRIQYDISAYLQHGPKNRFIEAFRGVGKSWLTAAYVVWRLWNNPQLKVMIVSANEKKAIEIATFIYNLIHKVPELAELCPGANQRTSVLSFDVGPAVPDIAPSVRADGIFGQLTGGRADILLSDDVEVPKNSETEGMRQKLARLIEEYGAIVKPGAETIFLGTPQSEESVYRGLPSKGYDVRIWPSRYPLLKNLEHYQGRLAPLLLKDMQEKPELCNSAGSDTGGAPTDPERFDDMDLSEREAKYRRSGFMLQFMLDVRQSDSDKHPLKLRDLIVMDVNDKIAPVQVAWAGSRDTLLPGLPNLGYDGDTFHKPMYISKDWIPYQGSVMVIDPAGRGGDEIGYVVVKALNGMLYLAKAGGLLGGYDQANLKALSLIAKEAAANLVRVESNFGDGMFTTLLGPILNGIYPVTLEEYKVSGQKELRILKALEPIVQGHRLVVDTSLIAEDANQDRDASYKLMHQLTHLTKTRGCLAHDDRLDALAAAVEYFQTMLGNDVNKAEKARNDKLWDAEVRKHFAAQGFWAPKFKSTRRALHRDV